MENKTQKEQVPDEKTYPSVGIAYELAIKSYDWVIKRLELMDDRIDKLIALMTGISLALISYNKTDFQNCFFYYLISAYIVATIAGLKGKHSGQVKIVSPTKLFSQWLHFSQWEFKKNAIYKAGEDYDSMSKTLASKNRWFVTAIIFYMIEIILLTLWITHH